MGRQTIVITAGKIVAISDTRASLPRELVAEDVELGGRRVIPGLIDGHVHVTGGGGEAGLASRVPAITLGALGGAGITTVVGLLGTDGTTRTIAELVAR